jgi:hypothetical protein
MSTSLSGHHLGLYNILLTAHCDRGGELDNVAKQSVIPSAKTKVTVILEAIQSISYICGRMWSLSQMMDIHHQCDDT